MHVLAINTGSSSIKLTAFAVDASGLTVCGEARYAADVTDVGARLKSFVVQHGVVRVAAVAHRVVHGGARLSASCRIDAAVETEIERIAPLAPLHNPLALAWIRACRAALGADVPQIAVFDTAFYAPLPAVAQTYAVPHELSSRHGLRRYGFHGLAHQAMCQRWQVLRPEIAGGGRVISFQLGAGCSVTASERGVARDTSMGFSPLEGLVMATRSGDIDPGLLLYLQRVEGMSPEDAARMLNEQSGLLGVSGISGDMRALLASDDARAQLAVSLYCYRARKYLGAYLAVLGGAEAILFGGGVGEHAAAVRAAILADFGWAGLQLDAAANHAATVREACISSADSRIQAWVIPVDEAQILAQAALPFLMT